MSADVNARDKNQTNDRENERKKQQLCSATQTFKF